jgi:hypothetical protein
LNSEGLRCLSTIKTSDYIFTLNERTDFIAKIELSTHIDIPSFSCIVKKINLKVQIIATKILRLENYQLIASWLITNKTIFVVVICVTCIPGLSLEPQNILSIR